MKTILLTIITILALVMSGCSNDVSEADMPEIVFKVCTAYASHEHNFDLDEPAEQPGYSLTFVDKTEIFTFPITPIYIFFLTRSLSKHLNRATIA